MMTRRTPTAFIATSVLLLALPSCAVERSHELGDEPSERSDGFAQSTESTEQPVAELMSEFDGLWVGEAEDPLSLSIEPELYHFPSGSTRITFEFHSDDPGASRLSFGEGPEIPPPTDPDAVYPEGAAEYVQASWYLEPFEGFAYPAYYAGPSLDDIFRLAPESFGTLQEIELTQRLEAEGRVVDGRLQVMYSAFDMIAPWCLLQPAERGCLPGSDSGAWGYADDGSCLDPAGATIDCAVVDECNNVCRQLNVALGASLLLQRTVDGLVGVFSGDAPFRNQRGFLAPIGPVRFRRASE